MRPNCRTVSGFGPSGRVLPPIWPAERAIATLRQAEDVPHQLLAHLSPLGWEHVNLTGDYIWSAEPPDTENCDGFRPLRTAPDISRKAA